MTKNRRVEAGIDSDNRPFSQLASLIRKAGIELHSKNELLQRLAPAPATLPQQQQEPADDNRLFERAMEGVNRVSWHQHPTLTHATAVPHSSANAEFEDARLLEEALKGCCAGRYIRSPRVHRRLGGCSRSLLPG